MIEATCGQIRNFAIEIKTKREKGVVNGRGERNREKGNNPQEGEESGVAR